MKLNRILLLSGTAVIAVAGAFASMHKAVKASKFSTVAYSKASGASFIWTSVRPTGQIACQLTSQSVFCTINFTPSASYTKLVNGVLPPTANFTTPDLSKDLYKATR